MKYLKLWENFENNNSLIISKKDNSDKEIKVFLDNIKSLVNFVGEGIDDIDFDNSNIRNNWKDMDKDEFQNEIYITFIENAWGGIGIKDWNKLNVILQEFIDKKQLKDFHINTSHNKITLIFDSEYIMGIY